MSRIRDVVAGNHRAWVQQVGIHVGEMHYVRLIVAAARERSKPLKRIFMAEVERRRRLEQGL